MAAHDLEETIMWHELLARVRVAERTCDKLIDEILSHHDELHSAPVRWCNSRPCRLAAELRRR